MDEIKLEKWKKIFNEEATKVLSEFEPSFESDSSRKLYKLSLDESSELQIEFNDELPDIPKQRLQEVLTETKPEDSVYVMAVLSQNHFTL